MQRIKIQLGKIDKTAIYQGQKDKYLDLTLMENRDGKDQYGNDGFVVQDIGKERREAGERGPIVGNWRYLETGGKAAPKAKPAAQEVAEDDCPF